MSSTKPQTEPQVVSLPSTASAGMNIRPQSVHSSIRSSHERGSVETPDKVRAGNDDEAIREKVDEGVIESHMYETINTHKRRNFLRRHLFVIGMIIIGLTITGIIVGVLIVKIALSKPGQAVGGTQEGLITTTDASGGLHTTWLPFPIISYLSTHDATPTPTS